MIITYSMEPDCALNSQTSIPNHFIFEHMHAAPDMYVKIYLFALMQYQNPYFANDDITTALDVSDEDVAAAFTYWQQKGLLCVLRSDPLHIEFIKEHTQTYSRKGKYTELIAKLHKVLGTRILNATELKRIYDWIEVFGLSEDAVETLFIYCINTRGQKVHIQYIDCIAREWADNHILTEEDAKSYIASNTTYHHGAKEILNRWNLHRLPTDDEVSLYRKWIVEYGLAPQVISEACAQLTAASHPTFKYLSKVIDTYYETGTINLADLEEEQKRLEKLNDFCSKLFHAAGLRSKHNEQQRSRINSWLTDEHITEEMLLLLAKYAASKAQPFSFICKHVQEWIESDIHNIQDAKAELESAATVQVTSHKAAGHYMQRKYTADEIKKLGIDFGDDNT